MSAGAVRELSLTLDSPAPAPPAPAAQDRFLAASQKVLGYVKRTHATAYQILSEFSHDGTSLTYLVQDASGGQAHLTWSRDTSLPSAPAAQAQRAELAAGRTPSGYPYRLTALNTG